MINQVTIVGRLTKDPELRYTPEGHAVSNVIVAMNRQYKNSNGEYLIKNTKVTGFANTEEIAVGLDKIVPFLTEDELVRKGANYVKDADWSVFTVTDNRIVTGQNPASGGAVAKDVIKLLKSL